MRGKIRDAGEKKTGRGVKKIKRAREKKKIISNAQDEQLRIDKIYKLELQVQALKDQLNGHTNNVILEKPNKNVN